MAKGFLKSRRFLVSGLIIIIVSINLCIIFINLNIFNSIEKLNNHWFENTSINLQRATYLTEVEHSFGYGGLIHNFKNYIIRRTSSYEQNVEQNYQDLSLALENLKNITSDQASLSQIQHISSTVEEYWQKFNYVKNSNESQYLVYEIDEKVKVDDTKAIDSLVKLRESQLPNVLKPFEYSKEQTRYIYELLLWGLFIYLPMLILSTIATVYVLIKNNTIISESRTVINASPDAIIYANSQGEILKSNVAAQKLFGYTEKEFLTMAIEDLIPRESRGRHHAYRDEFNQSVASRSMGAKELTIHGLTKNQKEIPLEIAIASTSVGGEIRNIAVIRDISEKLILERHATLDHLTYLKNRRAIDISLSYELERAYRYNRSLAVLMIDLDNFKILNDTEGHLVGDETLREVSGILSSKSRPSDTVGRWGGDEFILICPELNKEEAQELANRLVKDVSSLNHFESSQVTLSIGISVIDGIKGQVSTEALIAQADKALYLAKEKGRNQAIGHWQIKNII